MSDKASWRIFLAAEGPSDLRRIKVLVDHFLKKRWGAQKSLDQLRSFEGLDGEPYIPIKKINELARQRGLDRRYSPDGPNKGDGGTLRKLYQVLQKERLLAPRTIILWARDDDGDAARRTDAQTARASLPTTLPLLLAIASECGEAWVVAGWRPTPSVDVAKLKRWRKQLGFEPHTRPERLSHKENGPKSAKAVVKDIFGADEEQEAEALLTAVESTSQALNDCGLQAFRKEVEGWLASQG